MIAITGATGQLGRLVIDELLKHVPAGEVVAAVRSPERAQNLAARGVQVRHADYDEPATLRQAFAGVDTVLLISANEVGRRLPQHQAAIDAAVDAGVKLLAYTSILHADTSPLPLATEHKQTEAHLAASGLPHVLLRNGWYTENYLASLPAAVAHGALLGSAGAGRIASAARADYAAAAAAVLLRDDVAGQVFELAGDESYTLADLAATAASASGKEVVYRDLPQGEFERVLLQVGLPAQIATLLAESDVGASQGGLFDDSRTLSRLIGRPTTPWREQVAATLR